jgi:hypothetical protein
MENFSLEGVTFGLRPDPVVRYHRDTDFIIDFSQWQPAVFAVAPSDSNRVLSLVAVETYQFYGSYFKYEKSHCIR